MIFNSIVSIVHVLFGSLWVGSTIFFDLVIMRALNRLKNEQIKSQVISSMISSGLPIAFTLFALLTIVFGGIFVYLFTGGDFGTLMQSRPGNYLLVGAVLGLIVFMMGIYLGLQTGKLNKMASIMSTIASQEEVDDKSNEVSNPLPSEDLTQSVKDFQKTSEKVEKVSKVELVLMLLTVILMILSAYPP